MQLTNLSLSFIGILGNDVALLIRPNALHNTILTVLNQMIFVILFNMTFMTRNMCMALYKIGVPVDTKSTMEPSILVTQLGSIKDLQYIYILKCDTYKILITDFSLLFL